MYKILLFIILLVLEIPAAIFLVTQWLKACKEAKAEDGK